MKEQDLVNFINWLIESKEAPEGSSFEETVSWINELSTSEDGKQILNQLLNTYKKSNNMGLFKKGGKFDYLLCLKKGGNIQDCGCGKKITKHPVKNEEPAMQIGGVIQPNETLNQYPYASKQDVIKAMNQIGLNNKEARQAYRSSKREMRDLGLRGRSLRQAARYNLIDQVYPRAGMTEEEARRAMLDNLITKISYD